MPQVSQNPKWLVGEFQKSGEFDRLRKQLQTHFLNSDQVHPLMSRVEEIVREKLSSDDNLEHKTREAVYSEVMQDMERYPIVERVVANLAIDKDEALLTSVDEYLRNILQGKSNENTKLWIAQPASGKGEQGDDNDESSDYSEEDEPGDDELLIITDAEQKEDAPPSTKQPTSEIEILTNDGANYIALDDVKPQSGEAHPQSAPLNLPGSDSQPAPWSPLNQTDVKSLLSPPASPQVLVRPKSPSPAEGQTGSNFTGSLPVIDIPMGCSSGQAAKSEQARAPLDDHAECELSFQDPSDLLPQTDDKSGFHTAEALAPVPSSQERDSVTQQQDISSPAAGAGTYPVAIPISGSSQGPSQMKDAIAFHQPPHDPYRCSPSPSPPS